MTTILPTPTFSARFGIFFDLRDDLMICGDDSLRSTFEGRIRIVDQLFAEMKDRNILSTIHSANLLKMKKMVIMGYNVMATLSQFRILRPETAATITAVPPAASPTLPATKSN